ncbi:MAG: dihydroorotase family protein [Candidatus Aenigmarchaeota archaeon]|nr:dihydroorotase family protein [Candidatus Aenigmarchaeota archaeon]
MHDLAISGRVVDPLDGVYEATVLVSKGTIEKIAEQGKAKISIELASSQLLFPGFIDAHVHLREPGMEYKETFSTGANAALHGGVTTAGDMPNLPEPITTKERLLRKQQLAEKAAIDILHFGGVGSLQDIRALAPHVPAFKIFTTESNWSRALTWNEIEQSTRLIASLKKPITFHCEDQHINEQAKETLKGKQYAWKHCDERPPESEISSVQKVAALCKKYNAAAHIAHISTADAVKIASESGLTCEVTPHHLFFRKEDMRTLGNLLKVNPPLRSDAERRALLRALKKGRISTLATDHAPHTLQEKLSTGPSGMPGLDTYGNCVLWLMQEHNVQPELLARMTSHNAARYLNLKDRGRIKESFRADFAILDTQGTTVVRNKELYTKCGWSAFGGVEFPGRVINTIKNGVVLMKDGKVLGHQ